MKSRLLLASRCRYRIHSAWAASGCPTGCCREPAPKPANAPAQLGPFFVDSRDFLIAPPSAGGLLARAGVPN